MIVPYISRPCELRFVEAGLDEREVLVERRVEALRVEHLERADDAVEQAADERGRRTEAVIEARRHLERLREMHLRAEEIDRGATRRRGARWTAALCRRGVDGGLVEGGRTVRRAGGALQVNAGKPLTPELPNALDSQT